MFSSILDATGVNLTIGLVFIVIALYSVLFLFGSKGNLPPAAWNLPIVGYLPWLAANPDKALQNLGTKYGNVFRIRLGTREFYVLNDYEAVKEAMVKNGDVFAGRQRSFNLQTVVLKKKGILVEDGPYWKEQRRFAISSLRDVGFGKITYEENIQTECQRVVEIIASKQGKPFDLRPILINSITNIICSLAFGKIFEYDDPTFIKSCEYRKKIEDLVRNPSLTLFPWLRYFPDFISGMDKLRNIDHGMNGFIGGIIDDHKSTLDESNIRDFLDLSLIEIAKRQRANPNYVGPFDVPHLKSNLMVFFVAGVTTTVRTLEWATKFLTDHPDLQKELHQEVDAVVGQERLPSYRDRPLMPKTEAFIYETQRTADLVPFAVPHSNIDDAKLFGYDIPKRSLIISNVRAIHQDPQLWKDPQNFRPSRFLDSNNKIFKPDYFMPFGIGKRICMGESLARMELFLFLTAMLQKFHFVRSNTEHIPLEDGVFQRALKSFKIEAQPRN